MQQAVRRFCSPKYKNKAGDSMGEVVALNNVYEDFDVEFSVITPVDFHKEFNERQERIIRGLASIDEQLEETQTVLNQLNADINRLTNHADALDYMVAVGSGVLSSIIDIVCVGDFSLEAANQWGSEKIDRFVTKIAKIQGYNGNDLCGAVRYMEKKSPLAADAVTDKFGGGLQHHLRDFSHHPTPVGLFFSLLTQFTGMVYGTNRAGSFQVVPLSQNGLALVGKNFPEKITFGVINWMLHMVSDMAGSSSSILEGKTGTGLPGPIVSLLKELSALPVFHSLNENGDRELSVWISKLFNGTLLKNDSGEPIKFDLRTEIGIAEQLGKQALPVIVNECMVRGFYFVRHLQAELKRREIQQISDLKNIDWKSTLPFKNRTVVRMLTIATGTMTAIDIADATIESAIKSGGINPAMIPNMLVKINFVGIGRFAVAVGSDVSMGIKRSKLRNQRIALMNERLFLMNGRTFYKQANMWLVAEDTGKIIDQVYREMERVGREFAAAYEEIKMDLAAIDSYIPGIKEKNPKLVEDMLDILKWGV